MIIFWSSGTRAIFLSSAHKNISDTAIRITCKLSRSTGIVGAKDSIGGVRIVATGLKLIITNVDGSVGIAVGATSIPVRVLALDSSQSHC